MAKPHQQPSQPPPHLPNWMLTLDPGEQQSYGSLSANYNPAGLGYADMDQYSSGGIPPAGSMGERIQNNFQDPMGFGLQSNVAGSIGVGQTIQNGYQGLTSLDPKGYAVAGHDPTGSDRVNRALQGLLRGYDTGNTAGNVGLQAGASFVPGGQIANSAAGAIQGATSDDKVFKRVLPASDNSGAGYNATDVMPRGLYAGGMLEQPAPAGGDGYGGSGGSSAFGNNPLTGQPAPVSNPLQAGTSGAGFTGGSGRQVQPYQLPAETDLLSLLANAQRYGDYDASTGRTGFAGSGAPDGYSYAGFDFAQDAGNRDVGKSAKYAWAETTKILASRGIQQPRTKEEADAYARQAAPLMAQFGYPMSNIVGDKFEVAAREGHDRIDFLGDAGGANPVMTWQSEVLAPGGGMSTGPQGSGGSLPTAGMDLTSSALFEQLMQQVRDIAAGKSTGPLITDTNALLSLLRG